MSTISEWLNDPGRNYSDGIDLYKSVKFNKNILSNLMRKESKANMAKLVYELGKFSSEKSTPIVKKVRDIAVVNIQKPVAEVVQESIVVIEKKQSLMFHDLPEELRPVLLEANQTFKEKCMLKISLNELPAEAENEALKIILQIDSLTKRNAHCWKKIDYWLEHRSLPPIEASEFSKMTAEQRVKRQQYLFASTSKLRKRIDKNVANLALETSVNGKTRIEKNIAKQKSNLISQESDLLVLTEIIEGNG